jgi:hypothetical protein
VLGDGDVGFFAEIDGGLVNRQLLDGGPEVEVVALVFAGEAVVEFFGEMDREGSRGLGAAVRQRAGAAEFWTFAGGGEKADLFQDLFHPDP